MCGIAGAFGGKAREAVTLMSAAIEHRGRDYASDATLAARDGGARGAFAHRRLAIIDLSPTGRQPMESADGRYVIVFNGEIYNYRRLRAELESGGATFRGTSDTEVLLAGWAAHGASFLPRLRGMYAFGLWDRHAERGYLARDPFGIKPLYVAQTASAVYFASELRALLAAGVVRPELSREAIRGYLRGGSVPEPWSALRGATPLTPGSVVEVTVNGDVARLGEPRVVDVALRAPEREPERDRARAAALVRDALRDSVDVHLVSDVPVALLLSGGIDSSAVVALAAQQSTQRLDTFTVTFDEAAFNEAAPARAVAERFGTRHHEVPLSARDLLEALPHAFDAMDQPSMDGLNTYVVSRAVRAAGIKVVLSGLGGDELFGGYASFRRAARAGRMGAAWRWTAPLRRGAAAAASSSGRGVGFRRDRAALLIGADTPERGAYEASRALFAGPLLTALGGDAASSWSGPAAPPGFRGAAASSWYEVTGYMRDTLLRDSDVFSMAQCLELRVPFVDREVAAAALAVDDSLKLAKGPTKPILVDALRDLLPREVWDRPKQGFTLPFAGWMRGELRQEVDSVLTSADRVERVGLAPAAVQSVWSGFLAGRPGLTWGRAWALYTLVRWAERLGVEVGADDEAGG
ncbi:MAG TPA: asparagine synthase (glutamine-hydrolyzing) [Gemmatimonadaceae bacterium]|nr:asparagine synthase (glutamine-hydrolyzing) [Gemmatimonadaceae bacterium]